MACRLDQRLQHGLKSEGRAADHLKHVGSGGLLLEGLAQLVEQARVLDRNHGLVRKGIDELDLAFGERADFAASNYS